MKYRDQCNPFCPCLACREDRREAYERKRALADLKANALVMLAAFVACALLVYGCNP